jgi:hypothetical protein
MSRTIPKTVVAMALLVGCDAKGVPATAPATVDVPPPRAVAAAVDTPARSTAPATRAGDERPAHAASAACVTAFDDQRSLTVGPEVTIHPAREAAFLETCSSMPPLFQACASPLYQQGHEADCAAVHDEAGTPAKRAWRRTFDLLSDDRLDLPP